eukprot:scaffold3987_cov134-Cylindrotheca_fusiformis.AAC.12
MEPGVRTGDAVTWQFHSNFRMIQRKFGICPMYKLSLSSLHVVYVIASVLATVMLVREASSTDTWAHRGKYTREYCSL